MNPLHEVIVNKSTVINPIWIMRQAGRYLPEFREIRSKNTDFIKLCLNPQLSKEITLQPLKRFSIDAAIIFSDILMVPWAMGLNVRFEPGIGPLLDAVEEPDMIKAGCLSNLTDKLAPVGEALELTKLSLPTETSLIGFAGAPWTLITYIAEGGSSRDFTRARLWAWQNKKGLNALLEILGLNGNECLL